MFPPYDLWNEYYDINDLTEIIKQNKNEELVEFQEKKLKKLEKYVINTLYYNQCV